MARNVERRRNRIYIDVTVIVLVLLLCGFGLLNLYSASVVDGRPYHLRQLFWILLGSMVAGVVAWIDHRIIARLVAPFYLVAIGLLIAVPFVGTDLNTTARRWLDFGGFTFQPSELAKVVVIILTARYFAERPTDRALGFLDIAPLLALLAVPCGLIMAQPDLGTAVTVGLIFGTMFLFQRVRWTTLAGLAATGVVGVTLLWQFVMHDYQKARVLSFINPKDNLQGAAWQVTQSRIAIGSGQLTGKGYLDGTQVQNRFVPEHENDFVFAHHGEQFGFVGSVLLLTVYALLVFQGLRIARSARDHYSVVAAVGCSAFFFWHVVVNLGMVMGSLPVVGLWLPFASYGGSAMLTSMIVIGLMIGISARRQTFSS